MTKEWKERTDICQVCGEHPTTKRLNDDYYCDVCYENFMEQLCQEEQDHMAKEKITFCQACGEYPTVESSHGDYCKECAQYVKQLSEEGYDFKSRFCGKYPDSEDVW